VLILLLYKIAQLSRCNGSTTFI